MTQKKNRPGRKKSPQGPRSVRVTVAYLPSEYKEIEGACDHPATYIREASLAYTKQQNA